MNTHGLVLPQKMVTDSATRTSSYAKFIADPFERGYGHTVGHSLRRILLSSLEGAAVTAVRIKGAAHEFSSLKGVQEDVINLILNLKRIRLKLFSAGPEVLTLHVKKNGVVKAKDITANANVEILTPDQVIAHLDATGDLDIELEVNRGRGFVQAERLKREGQPIHTIFVDALFSPVKKVQYGVENARVGQMTDYDRLVLEVWTDGSISPVDAVARAAGILRESLSTFLPVETPPEVPVAAAPAAPVSGDIRERLKDLVDQPVDIIELSVRPSNCLKAAKIRTLGELLSKTEEELLAYKNFGQKSLDEIREKLKEMSLDLGLLATSGSKGA